MTWEQTPCFFCMRFFISGTADLHIFKEDKRGSLFRRGENVSKKPIHANDDRSYHVIWGLVIKIKCSGKTGALKWYKEGLIFLWEIGVIILDLVVISNGEFFRFIELFIYLIGLPVCCLTHNSSLLSEVACPCMPTWLTEKINNKYISVNLGPSSWALLEMQCASVI